MEAERLWIVPIRFLRQLGYEDADETIAMGAIRIEIVLIRILRLHGYESADKTVSASHYRSASLAPLRKGSCHRR